MNVEITTKKKEIAEIAHKYDLDMVVLFGSQATGRTHPKSDIDIGYTSSQSIELDTRFEVGNDISKLLSRDDIELVDLRRVSPLMKKIVSDEGIVLYEQRPGMFIAFCIYAFKLYVETEFLRQLRYESLKHFIYGTPR